MSISVVIPNFNGSTLLAQNLPHLYIALKKSGLPYEVIISDDASTDDSVSYIKKHFSDIIILENEKNAGFSINCNKGFAKAKYDWVLTLNTDVQIHENYFEPLLKYLNNNNLFSVGGSIWGFDGQLQDGGKYPAWSMQGLKTTVDFEPKKYITSVSTLFNSGACVLYRREKLMQLKGYNELFAPFYYEDAELCIRALRMGWECLYVPEAKCKHPNSVTIKEHHSDDYIKVIANRNKLIMGYLHYDGKHRNNFIVMIYIKLMFAWLGKTWHYKSYAGFGQLKSQINENRKQQTFKYTLSQVTGNLRTDLKGKVQRLF